MAKIRLVPSVLYNAASSYLSISNEQNAFSNTDDTTYATVENVYSRTSNRYVYLQGFNWDAIPSGAIINSFRILLKARESGGSTSSSYRPVLAKGTSIYNDTYCSAINTTASVHEFTFKQDFETFRDDGEKFGIRINCRRGSRNTVSYHYIYGAEIEVDYTVPNPRTVTSTLTGDGTINPSGATSTYEGAEYTLTITPTNESDEVRVTNNGVDVTSQLVAHLHHYTYTYTVSGDATIAVTIGGSGEESQFYIKETATQWDKYSKLWKKGTNGWIEVDPYEELDTSKQYRVVDVS